MNDGEGRPNAAQSSNEESSNEKSSNEVNPRIGIEGLRRKLLRYELGYLLHGLTASWADGFNGFNSLYPFKTN